MSDLVNPIMCILCGVMCVLSHTFVFLDMLKMYFFPKLIIGADVEVFFPFVYWNRPMRCIVRVSRR